MQSAEQNAALAKTAFVLGGSGFIGLRLVEALAKANWRVRVGVRNLAKARPARVFGEVGQVLTLRTPIQDETRLRAAVQGVDLVVNCVGILSEFGQQSFESVQSDGAIRLARLAAKAGVQDFVQISSLAADINSASNYARTKAEAEAGILSYMPQATILRPSLVFGAEDQFFNRFASMARLSPFLPLVGAGATKFQPVYVGDVVAAILASLERPEAKGQVFALCGPQVYSFRELLDYTLKTIRRRRWLVSLPESLASFIALLTGWLPGAPLTSDQLILLKEDTVLQKGDKNLADLGIEAHSLESLVPAYLEQYRPGGRFGTRVVRM